MDFDLLKRLKRLADTKIVFLVLDGLGGLPGSHHRQTELEYARTPNLDGLARTAVCGLHQGVGPGITPGSGPGHLALFGYDPLQFQVGRGVLAAMGIGFDLSEEDVAARGNFCTVGENGKIQDRRAGRIPTERCRKLCGLLEGIEVAQGRVLLKPVKDYRFLLVLRGQGFGADVSDTDPLQVGAEPLRASSGSEEGSRTAEAVNAFVQEAKERLAQERPANMLLLRGFSRKPRWPSMEEVFGVRAAAFAAYPMYRGLARLLGMETFEVEDPEGPFSGLEEQWKSFDFFFLHAKPTDSAGEDGDFEEKVRCIEVVDAMIPRLMRLNPDVVLVSGDHSTPSVLKSHSWHPVPVLIWSRHCRQDGVARFSERACVSGGLGPRIPSVQLMPIALANARRLEKFGP